MSALASLQREFIAALEAQHADARMDVHRRNIDANLEGALAAAYPVVRRLVGAPFFGEAARRFAEGDVPRGGDLREFGAGFAAFLEAYPHAARLAYLPDVARLEWACHESFHAAEAPAFDFAALAAIDARASTQLAFMLHPAVRLIRSPYRVATIWHAHQEGGEPAVPDVDGPEQVLVHRREGAVRVETLPLEEWDFLRALAGGVSLESAAEAFGEAAAQGLAPALQRFVAAGVIGGFRITPGA